MKNVVKFYLAKRLAAPGQMYEELQSVVGGKSDLLHTDHDTARMVEREFLRELWFEDEKEKDEQEKDEHGKPKEKDVVSCIGRWMAPVRFFF